MSPSAVGEEVAWVPALVLMLSGSLHPCSAIGTSLVGAHTWAPAGVASLLLHAEEQVLVAGCGLFIPSWDQVVKAAQVAG